MDEPLSLHPYAKETPLTESARTGIDAMSAELAEGHTASLSTLLGVMSRHPRRSLMNQILIVQQAPEATDLATFDEWAAQGYAVAKGQTGIRLLQQRSWTHTNLETGEEELAQGIVSVPFFDVTQLNVEQRAERPVTSPLAHVASLLGNPGALSAQLEHALAEAGIAIVESEQADQSDGAEGSGHRARKANTLVLRPGLSEPDHVVDLLYAYAQQLVRYDQQRAPQATTVRQTEAAIVTFVIGARYGVGVKLPPETLRALNTTPEGLIGQLDTMRSAISRLARRIEGVAASETQTPDSATAGEEEATSGQAMPAKTRTRRTTQHREAAAQEEQSVGLDV